MPTERSTFGILGGYGATGRAVVAELLKSSNGELLIGGRDPSKLKSVTAGLGNRVSAARVDALDAASLDVFCGRCSVIVNCAGPVCCCRTVSPRPLFASIATTSTPLAWES